MIALTIGGCGGHQDLTTGGHNDLEPLLVVMTIDGCDDFAIGGFDDLVIGGCDEHWWL